MIVKPAEWTDYNLAFLGWPSAHQLVVSYEDSVALVLKFMHEHRIDGIPVDDEEGVVVAEVNMELLYVP